MSFYLKLRKLIPGRRAEDVPLLRGPEGISFSAILAHRAPAQRILMVVEEKNGMCRCKSEQRIERAGESLSDAAWSVILLSWVLWAAGCAAAPDRFAPEDRLDPTQVTHQDLEMVLRSSVRDGRVDYPAIQADPRFDSYVADLNRIDPQSLTSEADRLAFWINAYNAFAIRGILDGYSPEPYVGWYRYFKVRTYAVGGREITLSDLEHGILRRRFSEPRIHFALVCASLSCPKLPPYAFRGDRLDEQLDAAARSFVNDPDRNRFDRRAKVARLSKIFDWFEEDFAAAGGVLAYVSRYLLDPELARELSEQRYRVEYLDYDWSLNGIPPKEKAHAGAP